IGPATRRPAEVVTSPAWIRPEPDDHIAGVFLEFVCDPTQPHFKIEKGDGKVIELKLGNPKEVKILNTTSGESSIELKCGPQGRRPIELGIRRSDGTVLQVDLPQVHDLKRF